jgi:DNA-directed RNA polymerase subunit M/transcription elongation factor TFIIS
MQFQASGYESERLICPACGNALAKAALEGGQKLVRCRSCGNLVRRRLQPTVQRPAYESAPPDFEWTPAWEGTTRQRLEIVQPAPPYLLQCPYCEHLNRDEGIYSPQQFCANCGADVLRPCPNCGAGVAVLDFVCGRCGSDQEAIRYEIEMDYWQRFNEGKRLAQAKQWEPAARELGLFLDKSPNPPYERNELRQARRLYVTAIAPHDNGEGLRLYNEALAQIKRAQETRQRQKKLQKSAGWIAAGVGLVVLTLVSVVVFGSWALLIVPVAIILLLLVIYFLLAGLGLL